MTSFQDAPDEAIKADEANKVCSMTSFQDAPTKQWRMTKKQHLIFLQSTLPYI